MAGAYSRIGKFLRRDGTRKPPRTVKGLQGRRESIPGAGHGRSKGLGTDPQSTLALGVQGEAGKAGFTGLLIQDDSDY